MPSVVNSRRTIFYGTSARIVVEAPGRLMRQLIEACNGTRSLNSIVRPLKKEWDENSLRGLLKELHRRSIIVDSRSLASTAWKLAENPSTFPSFISDARAAILGEQAQARHKRGSGNALLYQATQGPLGELLERRRSVRSFSKEPVALQNLISILWSAYGEINGSHGRRTVPSAGALYPLVLHVGLCRQVGELSPGVYRVCLGSPGAVGFHPVSTDIGRFIRAFLDPLMIEEANGAIVISGSFGIAGEKYTNRSILYVPLEAGHAAQNIHLAASENSVAAVEIGGFVEKLLAGAIRLPRQYRPLTTVVFGCEGEDKIPHPVGTDWAVPMAGQYRPPFTVALARVSANLNKDWSCGRDVSPSMAHTKAVAEAREWAAAGCVPALVTARFADLDTAIDPRTVIRFHPSQHRRKGFPFALFDEDAEYEWAEGQDELTGEKVHILADLVYFPYTSSGLPYAYANSSGVAAHPDRQKAVETSTLELIERDSFMIAYLTKLAFPTVAPKTLPEKIRRRVRQLEEIGFRVWIKDHTLDLAPVVFVFAQNAVLHYTTCASCANMDIEYGIDHALMEVEASVLGRLQNGPSAFRQPRKVAMPADHGAIYEQKPFFRRADFMAHGGKAIAFRNVGRLAARSWHNLLGRFAAKQWRLFTVPLSLSEEYGGNGDLHIIRSIVPGMVPMTFGYQQEPGGMERIYAVVKSFGGRATSYRDLPRFPHPFN